MATQYGTNAANLIAVPQVKITPGDGGGKVRVVYEEFNIPATTPPTNDIVLLGQPLPPGARLIDVRFVFPAWGGSGAIDIGWAANETDAADATAVLSNISVTSAGTKSMSIDNAAGNGMGKEFNLNATLPRQVTQLQMKIRAAGTATSGKNVFVISYLTE